jgi:hypothetical protein
VLQCAGCEHGSGRRLRLSADHSLEFQQLAPKRIILRRMTLVEVAKLFPNPALSPEEDETKEYEYELH